MIDKDFVGGSYDCNLSELQELAVEFSKGLKANDLVFLEGELGAGKSTFVKFILESLGVDRPPEGSPTFSIANEYQANDLLVAHIDFYRLKNESEILDSGLSAYFWETDALILSEWTSRFEDFYAKVSSQAPGTDAIGNEQNRFVVDIKILDESTRNLQIIRL